jgi:hypothetical protein
MDLRGKRTCPVDRIFPYKVYIDSSGVHGLTSLVVIDVVLLNTLNCFQLLYD